MRNTIWHLLTTNKTKIAGVLTAILIFITAKGWIDQETGIMITGILAALGLTLSKDSNKHSTTDQVKKADDKSRGLK